MKLEVGKEYKDEIGSIIDAVCVDIKDLCGQDIAIVICKNEGNYPTWYPLDGSEMQTGSMFRPKVIECVGNCEMPIFKRVQNRQGEAIDYLVNYQSKKGLHLGIIHNDYSGNAFRCYSEKGEIECSMRRDNEFNESIPGELLTY